MKLLHPFTPFITEELWQKFKPKNDGDLIVSDWPNPLSYHNDEVEFDMDKLKDVITSIRSVRSRMNIPNSKTIELIINVMIIKKLFFYPIQNY